MKNVTRICKLTMCVLLSIVMSSTFITAFADTQPTEVETSQPQSYESYRTAFFDALDTFKNATTADNMKALIDSFTVIPTLSDYPVAGYQEDKNNFSDSILEQFKNVTVTDNPNIQSDLLSYFASQEELVLEQSLDPYDYVVLVKLTNLLTPGDQRTELATKLDAIKADVFPASEGYIDWNNPPDNLVVQPYVPPTESPSPGDNGSTPASPPVDVPSYTSTRIDYVAEAGVCYKELSYYTNGVFVKTEKVKPDKSEIPFCGISSSSSNGTGSHAPVNTSPKGYDPYSTEQQQAVQQHQEEQQEENPITIQFTLNKSLESPYYNDTGIRVNEDRMISYDQAKDAIHAIAVLAKGKFVEDADKALILIDGKIIVVKNGEKISSTAFMNLFSQTSVEIRIMDTRSGKQDGVVDLVEIKGVNTITINGKFVKLADKAIVDNGVALFPLVQVATKLGGTVNEQNDKVTISFKNHKLEYEIGKSTVMLDAKEYNLIAPVRKSKNGTIMAPIRALVDTFGFKIETEGDLVVIN